MSDIRLHFIGTDYIRRELTISSDGAVSLECANLHPTPESDAVERRWPQAVGDAEVALGAAVYAALDAYLTNRPANATSARIARLEAFCGELVSGAFPHLAQIVPAAHLGDAVKALQGD